LRSTARKARLRPPRDWHIDAFILLLIVLAWMLFAWQLTAGRPVVMLDTFRDMAYAENIRAGRIWSDPTIPGLAFWYPPGNAALFALASRLTGRTPPELYATAALWLNWIGPCLLYLLVRSAWGRVAGVLAVPLVGLGSMWWLTHALGAMPSVHGVALNLITLLLWRRCAGGASGRAIATGLALAAAAWHHPLCALIVAGTIFLDSLAWPAVDSLVARMGRTAPPDRNERPALRHRRPAHLRHRSPVNGSEQRHPATPGWSLLPPMLLVAAIAGVLAAPLIWHLVRIGAANDAPYRYVAQQLSDLRYAAHAHAPLVPLFGLLGVRLVLWRTPRERWIVSYLVISLLGLGLGQLRAATGWPLPALLPHQFQWHAQLALCACAAVWIPAAASTLTRCARQRWVRRFQRSEAILLLAAAALVPALGALGEVRRWLVFLDARLAGRQPVVAWIRQNTPLDAVFACPPEDAYVLVAGLTGRKCVAVPAGHMNPGVNAQQRLADLERMLEAEREEDFLALARAYGVTHLLILRDSSQDLSAARQRYASWECLEPAFQSEDDPALIYRIRAAPGGRAQHILPGRRVAHLWVNGGGSIYGVSPAGRGEPDARPEPRP